MGEYGGSLSGPAWDGQLAALVDALEGANTGEPAEGMGGVVRSKSRGG